MGAGGLNGELRTYSNDIDPQLRCNIHRFSREFAASSNSSVPADSNPSNNPSSLPVRSSYPTSNSDQDNDEQNMTCEDCGAHFSLFKRKNNCSGCKKSFCNTCFNQGAENAHRLSGKHCLSCRALASPILYKEQLIQLKIRNLQAYLRSVQVSTTQCKEKRDLVDLIIKHAKTQSLASGSSGLQYSTNPTTQYPGGNQSQNPRRSQPGVEIPPGPFGVPPPRRYSQGGGRGTRPPHPIVQQVDTLLNNVVFGPSSTLPGVPQYSASYVPPGDSTSRQTVFSQRQDQSTDPSQNKNNKPPGRTIEDLTDVEQIDELSVKELKQILTANFVDFTGCCEKQELLDRARLLWTSKNVGKSKVENPDSGATGSNEEDLCKICMDAAIDCVLLECGHMVTCTACGKQLVDCPMCRQNISRIVHVFRS